MNFPAQTVISTEYILFLKLDHFVFILEYYMVWSSIVPPS